MESDLTTPTRGRLDPRDRALRPRIIALVSALVWASFAVTGVMACTSDVVVYRSPDATDGGTRDAAPDAGRDPICRGGVDGVALAASILDLIAASVDLRCETDSDCDTTPVLPRCDRTRFVCTGCPDLAEKIADLTACLADARQRCCNTRESPLDCIYRDCVPGCDGP